MLKKTVLGVLVAALVGAIAVFVWARSVLAQDSVRTAIAARLTQALGQPVSIGGIGASIYPRVAVDLYNVTIGPQANIRVNSLRIGTDFRALLSRRIEHGSMRLTGARIQLPLPAFAPASPGTAPSSASAHTAPVEIGSIDEIVLSGVDIVSGGRMLHGDIDVVPQGNGVLVRKILLDADNANVDITGRITDLAGPTGELTVKSGALDLSRLLAFVSDFSTHAGIGAAASAPSSTKPAASTGASSMDVAVTVDAARATLGGLVLDKLSGRARITADGMALQPIAFGIFGGRCEGSLALTLGAVPGFRLKARLSGIDVDAVTRAAGSPNTITGRLSGDIDVSGRGLDAASIAKSARGTLHMDIANGVVKNLGLIQAVVLATSMRAGSLSQSTNGARDEPFTRLGGTLTIANGEGTTRDLQFEAKDLSVALTGGVRLDGSAVDLKGRAQLSEALSQQAGRDLVRYTQEQGRVTLPATIDGPAQNLHVRIDAADVAKRALVNRAHEELTKSLGKLLRRR